MGGPLRGSYDQEGFGIALSQDTYLCGLGSHGRIPVAAGWLKIVAVHAAGASNTAPLFAA